MKILHVIHGYPPYYMAGSEVYTYNLTQELALKGNEVYVFTRVENPFESPYVAFDEKVGNVYVRRINKPFPDYSLQDKYIDRKIENEFKKYLDKVNPDIVHIQHLSHLSTNIVKITYEKKIPMIYTLHDYWLICVRGQLISRDLKICSGPNDSKCHKCLSYLHPTFQEIIEYRRHMANIINMINLFLSPSRFLINVVTRFGIPKHKVVYSPYGFKKDLIIYREKIWRKDSKITFGYVGRIIPSKGVHHLIKAFKKSENRDKSRLIIFGDPGKYKKYLEQMIGESNIELRGGFDNRLIDKVLNEIDVLVVPSIWFENSPLVIQEAFLKGIPVITSGFGGMSELVKDHVNGFLFPPGNINALSKLIDRIIRDPSILNSVKPNPNNVRSIEDDASFVISKYMEVISNSTSS